MKWTLVDSHGLDDVLTILASGREVYALEELPSGGYALKHSASWQPGRHTLGAFRPTEPLKALFFPAREFVGKWRDQPDRAPMPERIVFGVKNCDLSSLAIYDYVFLGGDHQDPWYAEARERTLLVATDCSAHLDVCFCPAVGEQPFPVAGFDINITPTPMGHVIESGTERGEAALEPAADLLQPAGGELLAARERQREKRLRDLVANCESHGIEPGTNLQAAVEGAFESALWADFAADCVECGACNFICCTCHCFLLADGVDADGDAARTRLWDACLYPGFARVAGGGNPRPMRAERLRNRFDKKFSFFPQVLGRYACDGCGRCTEACIAKIDIRTVLRRAVDESNALHAGSGNH
jgi:ferredoxin